VGGKHSRDKGKRGEREIRDAFVASYGQYFPRTTQSDGAYAPDIDVPGLWVEVKRGKKPSLRAALRQAISDSAYTDRIPLAVVRDDAQPGGRKPPAQVVLRLQDFLTMTHLWWRSEVADA
jgi:hypothetical protein